MHWPWSKPKVETATKQPVPKEEPAMPDTTTQEQATSVTTIPPGTVVPATAHAESVIQKIEGSVGDFFKKLAGDVAKGKAIWNLITATQVRALMVKLFADAVKIVNDVTADVGAEGLNLALDLQTVNDIRGLITEAKSDEGVIASDFKALGISLPKL